MMRSKFAKKQGVARKHWQVVSIIMSLFVLFAAGGSCLAQGSPSQRPVISDADKEMPLDIAGAYKVEEIRFDPMAAGRNRVSVKLRNLTEQSQRAGIRIQTMTRQAGWGSSNFGCDLTPLQERWYTFHFTVRDDFIETTWIAFRFTNPPSDGSYQDTRFYGSELERREPDTRVSLPATPELAAAITSRFREFQNMLKQKRFDDAWNILTVPFQEAEFLGAKGLFEWTLNAHKPSRIEQYLSVKPKEVVKKGTQYILHGILEQADWRIVFTPDHGRWKIDAIEGYVRASLKDRILATMQNRTARHFDIYYKTNSTAERDIDKIADERESGYDEICKFLEREPNVHITLVLFEDMASKLDETGHQGAGMAGGTNIVEVYNDKMHLDPFHEATHILAKSLGRPPAVFCEGLATYMSERLGAPPLKELGGGRSSLYQRVRELRGKGHWIPLEELLTYTEIGPGWSRPPLAYAQAGGFVKFLVETYGKGKFLQAYRSLTNSKVKSVLKQNEGKLAKIYGHSLADLEKQWIEAVETQEIALASTAVSPRIEAAAKALREFLKCVREKDSERAWDLSSEHFRNKILKVRDFEQFKAGADMMAATPLARATVHPELSAEAPGGNVGIRIMGPSIDREMYFILVEEDGQWKILEGYNK